MNNHRKWTLFFALIGLSRATLASESDLLELPLEELMQITITSTSYFDQTIMESANSVSYSGSERWDELGVRNIGEVLNNLPSTVAPQAHGKTRVVAIRGYFNFAIDTGVATRLDNIPINTLRFGTGMLAIDGFDLATLDNIELLRGPGSSLHGADAFHGALSLNTVKHGDTGVQIRFETGSEQYTAASLVSRYSDDQQQLTTALAHRKIGDQYLEYPYTDIETSTHQTGTRSNELENANLVIKYSANPYGNTQYHASVYAIKLDANQLLGLGRQQGEDTMLAQDWTDYSAQLNMIKTGLDHRFSSGFRSSIYAYFWNYADKESLDLRFTPISFLKKEQRNEDHWGIQAINRHEFFEGSNLAYGYEYNKAQNKKFITSRSFSSGSEISSDSPQQGADEDYHSLMLDGRSMLPYNQLSSIAYGVRFDYYKHFDLQASPRLGYIHAFNNAMVGKVLLGRSYRKPNTFEVYGESSVAPNPDLKPETLNNLELVLQHNADHFFISATAFKNKWNHSIRAERLAMPVNGQRVRFINTSTNEAWGLELETLLKWQKWRMDLSVSHIKSQNIDADFDYDAFPDWMLNLGLGYEFSTQWDIYLFNRYHHRQAESAPSFGQEASFGSSEFFRTDITLSWTPHSDLKLAFSIRNLFDRNNYMPAYFDREGGSPDNGINASVSLKWNLF